MQVDSRCFRKRKNPVNQRTGFNKAKAGVCFFHPDLWRETLAYLPSATDWYRFGRKRGSRACRHYGRFTAGGESAPRPEAESSSIVIVRYLYRFAPIVPRVFSFCKYVYTKSLRPIQPLPPRGGSAARHRVPSRADP
ncbi:hypothetical protein SDC9_118794 [bioreactor metagenome]|uniref:Uncharacterized protein n=1 Tax=bioreactor metagenome TaxID=1076179 RepID=A0A645C8A9_9ZZZZ